MAGHSFFSCAKQLPCRVALVLLVASVAYSDKTAVLTSDNCSCFVTNSSSSAYYTNHQFIDYRNIDSASYSTTTPTLITSANASTNADVTSDYFSSTAFTNVWSIQTWNNSDVIQANNASYLMINSQSNIYISPIAADDPLNDPAHKTHLTMRTARTSDFQAAAEIDSNEANFHYISARFLARVTGSPGACAGLFTYLGPSDSTNDPKRQVQEADIEILTTGPRNVVQYTNQPSFDPDTGDVIDGATINSTIPNGADWSTWNVYRLDWTPKSSNWYVNGQSVANISFQTPKDPSSLILNMWSDGGAWTGEMALHDEAFLDVQWIELVYNTSGAYSGGGGSKRSLWDGLRKRDDGCKVVCSVDSGVNSTSVGTPQVVQTSDAASNDTHIGFWLHLLVLGALGVMLV